MYKSPAIEVLGSLRELTLGGGGYTADGVTPNPNDNCAGGPTGNALCKTS